MLDLDVPNRWEALRAVSATIERSQRLSAAPVFRALWRRELAASTGVGNGFAIPHARIAGIADPVTVYVRTKAPVDFAAPDRKPVSELFVILVPADGAERKEPAAAGAGGGSVFGSRFSRPPGRGVGSRATSARRSAQWISDKQSVATEGATA